MNFNPPDYFGVSKDDDSSLLTKALIQMGIRPDLATTYALDATGAQYWDWSEIIGNEAIKNYFGSKINPIKVRKLYLKYANPITDMYMASEFGSELDMYVKEQNRLARLNGWK